MPLPELPAEVWHQIIDRCFVGQYSLQVCPATTLLPQRHRLILRSKSPTADIRNVDHSQWDHQRPADASDILPTTTTWSFADAVAAMQAYEHLPRRDAHDFMSLRQLSPFFDTTVQNVLRRNASDITLEVTTAAILDLQQLLPVFRDVAAKCTVLRVPPIFAWSGSAAAASPTTIIQMSLLPCVHTIILGHAALDVNLRTTWASDPYLFAGLALGQSRAYQYFQPLVESTSSLPHVDVDRAGTFDVLQSISFQTRPHLGTDRIDHRLTVCRRVQRNIGSTTIPETAYIMAVIPGSEDDRYVGDRFLQELARQFWAPDFDSVNTYPTTPGALTCFLRGELDIETARCQRLHRLYGDEWNQLLQEGLYTTPLGSDDILRWCWRG